MKKYLSITLLLAVFFQCETNDINYEINEQETTRDAGSGQATGKRRHEPIKIIK